METTVGDILHCEEQLRTSLHSDDKDKLRRKLADLQREYLRTAQRLQRAERLEAVRRHVRSRIAEQNHQDQRDTEATSDPHLSPSLLIPNSSSDTAQGLPQCQGHAEGPADSDNSRRSQVIRFLLPSDAGFPQTPDLSHDPPAGHRSSPSLRLRSRRSRLLWESRNAEGGGSTDSSEKGQEQSEGKESARAAGEDQKVKPEGADVMNESEELFSGTDSECPSLLLTHWSTHGCTETGDIQGKDIPGHQQQREQETKSRTEGQKGSESLLLTCHSPATETEDSWRIDTKNGRRKEVERGENGENSRGQNKENINKDTEQNVTEKIETKSSHDNSVEVKEEKNGFTGDGKSMSLLDSCTLVEGLLFPVEYYVRTTRRMTFSQSQPDMQAVIVSQLSRGRLRRSRGRGRGQNRNTHTSERSEQQTRTDFSCLATASADPSKPSQAVGVSAVPSQSSGEISDHTTAYQINSGFSPTVTTARPARGRRRKRGRGTSKTPRASPSLNTHQLAGERTSDDPQPTNTPVSPCRSLQGADGPKPCPTPGTDEPQHVSMHITDSPLSSGVNGPPSSSASGHSEKVYPIFMKRSIKANRSPHMNRSTSNWRSLLLPSSSPAQTSLLPLPSLSSGPQMNLDIHQDFHLPDDQFASLKLHKLRQVATESGVEPFSSPSYNTRSSWRRFDSHCSSSDQAMALPFPLSLTLTIANSSHHNEEQLAASHSTDTQNLSIEHKFTDKLISQSLTEEQQTENLFAERHSTSTEPKSMVQRFADDCVDEEHETVNLNSSVEPRTHVNTADGPAGIENDYVIDDSDKLKIKHPAPETQTVCYGAVHPSEDLRSITRQTEDKVIIETVSFESPLQESPSNGRTALQASNVTKASGESPLKRLNVPSSAADSNEPSDLSPNRLTESRTKCSHSVSSQLLLSSPLASAPCPFTTPHLPSSTLTSSPKLPSLGLTPHPVTCSLPLTFSPSAPFLTLPPPYCPSTQAVSPPALSPCHSITCLPPGPPPLSPSGQIEVSSEPPVRGDQHHTVEPAAYLTPSSSQLEDSIGQLSLRTQKMAEELVIRHMHTLKAAAGGALVDACCFSRSSGGLCVAAAGKWAVCLWSQTSVSEWNLTHTWTFSEPVINVFPVLDAAGLICVTLGQLEIKEVRTLSCSSLMQMLLCEGVFQAVVGVSKSRVVTTSHSVTGSSLQVFTLSDYSSPRSQSLVSPGVCVGALAPVDGLPDALIGTDEGGHLFVWNLKTGQLLCRVLLGEVFSHTACLRGYSYCGVLFVLLQHQFLSSLEEEEKEAKIKDQKTALFSLVAINPLSGKSVPTTRLYPPKTWAGRLCEADVNGCGVVGLSQNGCVCVWELGRPGASRMVWAPESEGWQLARWGGRDTLVTGHHNGDVTLHCYSQTALCC